MLSNLFTRKCYYKLSKNIRTLTSTQITMCEIKFDQENKEDYIGADENSDLLKNNIRNKFRQHVNPLASAYQQKIILEDKWIENSFENVSKPFIIDIGCSKGSWALNMCQQSSEYNILGLEIRKPVVDFANHRKEKRGLKNVHFISTNANVNIEKILNDITLCSKIEMVCIQFPDPHFKTRHKKRRVVNEEFVNILSRCLSSNSKIFVQSDVFDVIEDMVQSFLKNINFSPANNYSAVSLDNNISPVGIKTEREIATLARNLPVYRMLFVKN